jgi:microcystin-dependent protein
MAVDLLGPANAANSVTADPGDGRTFGASDTFFKDCTPGNNDGTAIGASFLNGILKQVRNVIRGLGITADNTNANMLLQAIQSVQPAYGVDTGTANALVADVNQPGWAIAAGKFLRVKVANPVTGAATVDIKNGGVDLGTFNIKRTDGTDPLFYELLGNEVATFVYDGSVMQLQKAAGPSAIGKPDFFHTSGALSRYVRANALTIGSGASGATERANSDTQGLYRFLWNNFSNTVCPVTGGRGASADADFTANKPIQLPDLRGRILIGADDMGNTAASRFSSVFQQGNATTIGSISGENTHALATSEMPAHNHAVTDPGHTHAVTPNAATSSSPFYAGGSSNGPANYSALSASSATTGVSIQNTGGGGAHNVMQQGSVGTWYLRLY